jgi:hypothetical protein
LRVHWAPGIPGAFRASPRPRSGRKSFNDSGAPRGVNACRERGEIDAARLRSDQKSSVDLLNKALTRIEQARIIVVRAAIERAVHNSRM